MTTRQRWPVVVTLVAAAVAYVPRLNWILPYEDASVIGAWAMQAAAGQVPYRDFFVFTTPGSVVLYAAVFKLAGASVIVERIVTGAAVVLSAWALLRIARRYLADTWAVAVTVVWSAWLGAFYQYGPHHFWGTACLLLAALAVVERRFVLAGLAAAGAVLFMQATAVAVLGFCAIALLVDPNPRRSLGPMAAAGLAVAVLAGGWLVAVGAAGRFITDAVVFNLEYYPRANGTPFPWLPFQLGDTFLFGSGAEALWLLFFGWPLLILLPALIALAAGVGLVRWRGRGPLSETLLLALLSTALFAAAVPVRPTAPLAWFAAPLAFVLAARRLSLLARGRGALVPVAVFGVSALIPVPAAVAVSCELNQHGWRPVPAVGGDLCAPAQYAPQLAAAYRFHKTHPDARVAFLPVATSYYLVLGEIPPVPEAWVFPALEMPGQVQGLESALVGNHVEYVFYFEMPNSPPEPNGQADLDAALERHYRLDQSVDAGGLPVWRLG